MSSNRVQQLRQAVGFTVKDLAERAGMTAYALRRIESGESELTKANLGKLSEALGVSPTDLTGEPGRWNDDLPPLPFVCNANSP